MLFLNFSIFMYKITYFVHICMLGVKMANIRVADNIKKEADFKFAEVGLTTSIAVQVFLLKFIKTGKFPFEIEVPEYTPNAETLAAFAETEEMLRTGNFTNIDESVGDFFVRMRREVDEEELCSKK
jgi:DNA-damage-inducible protein J